MNILIFICLFIIIFINFIKLLQFTAITYIFIVKNYQI